MSTAAPTTKQTGTFSRAERRALRALRARYLQDRDLFSSYELARLHFMRWLYQTGRLAP